MREVHEDKMRPCRFPKDIVLKIASFSSASTLSNLYAAFFNSPVIRYDEKMFKIIENFCNNYQTKKKLNASDLERFDQVDNFLIEDLVCLFDYLKNKLTQSKDTFIEQYYRSGRSEAGEMSKFFAYFNTITEALIRFLWLHILLGDFSFRNMANNKYSNLVLYSKDYFLKSEKSRERTKHLNCTFQNLFIEYVSVILDYADYIGFTQMVSCLDLKIKLECFQFHYPDSLAQENDLRQFTMVSNSNRKLKNHWHYTTDIFFSLTVDNDKFSKNGRDYCASDDYLDDENCQDAVDFICGCSTEDLLERINRHSSYIATDILEYNAYAEYLLDIKRIDDEAHRNYIQFCDEYLNRQNRPGELRQIALPRPTGNSTSLVL